MAAETQAQGLATACSTVPALMFGYMSMHAGLQLRTGARCFLLAGHGAPKLCRVLSRALSQIPGQWGTSEGCPWTKRQAISRAVCCVDGLSLVNPASMGVSSMTWSGMVHFWFAPRFADMINCHLCDSCQARARQGKAVRQEPLDWVQMGALNFLEGC